MHRSNIQKSNTSINSRFSIDIASFSWIFSPIAAFPKLEFVSGKFFAQVCIDKTTLRIFIIAEYDSSGMPLGRVINRKSTELRENLASKKISPATFQYRFSSLNIINTVFHHPLPIAFVNWLIPRQVQFHVM